MDTGLALVIIPEGGSTHFENTMATTLEIDQLAQKVFEGSLSPPWLIREQNPDIHVDYFVEIADNSIPSGVVFGVQLKGTGSPRYSKNLIKTFVKTKHISYYLDKVKQPIFLVVVDVKKKQGYWIFIQEWANEKLKIRNWRQQRKIDIGIPITNSLSDIQRLRGEISRAEIYMRELWPSSIPAAVKYEKKSLEALDHRIKVDISYVAERMEYNLQPRESFDFDIQFTGASHVQEKLIDLLDYGKSAIFDVDEIDGVKGSPLLQKMFDKTKKGKLVIEPARKVQTSLVLSTIDPKEKERTTIYDGEGMMWAGNKEARFEGSLKGSPLKINFTYPFPPSLKNNPLTVNLNFDTSQWQDKPILSLPYFEKLKDFFVSIHEGSSLRIICEINGNHIFAATIHENIDPSLVDLPLRHLQMLDKARLIAREAHIRLLYPKDGSITEDECKTIFLLHQLIKFGEHRQSGNGVSFRATLLPNDNFFSMFEGTTPKMIPGPLVFEPNDQKSMLFGKEFEFGLLRYTLSNPLLATDLSKVRRTDKHILDNGIEVEWSGGPESELIISKL